MDARRSLAEASPMPARNLVGNRGFTTYHGTNFQAGVPQPRLKAQEFDAKEAANSVWVMKGCQKQHFGLSDASSQAVGRSISGGQKQQRLELFRKRYKTKKVAINGGAGGAEAGTVLV